MDQYYFMQDFLRIEILRFLFFFFYVFLRKIYFALKWENYETRIEREIVQVLYRKINLTEAQGWFGYKIRSGTKEVLGMSDMSFLVYGMLFDRLPADWTNAFWNIGDHCLLWPCEINEYTLLMQRLAIERGVMGKTNELNLFLLFNRQKFPNPGFFFSLSSFRKFFPILLHREIETQIEILVSSIVFYYDFLRV